MCHRLCGLCFQPAHNGNSVVAINHKRVVGVVDRARQLHFQDSIEYVNDLLREFGLHVSSRKVSMTTASIPTRCIPLLQARSVLVLRDLRSRARTLDQTMRQPGQLATRILYSSREAHSETENGRCCLWLLRSRYPCDSVTPERAQPWRVRRSVDSRSECVHRVLLNLQRERYRARLRSFPLSEDHHWIHQRPHSGWTSRKHGGAQSEHLRDCSIWGRRQRDSPTGRLHEE